MWRLSDEALWDAYKQARSLDLDPCFIQELADELTRRSIDWPPDGKT